ncbi:ABC transporter substrate-binding protein [Sagittula sp. SSi028]|uniref:ABC transporter substrate-binding protein n=1 Tax=Sagittula sp. SSi028 TaxID=3400636 RepID=UPI003AF4B1D4
MKHSMIAAAVGIVLGAVPAFAEMTDIKFTLGWKTQGSDAPFLVALHKGYFEDEGLNVTIDQGEGSAATITRIMGGAYDAGFGDINAIIQNASARPGEAPVMVFQMWNRPPFAIAVPKDSDITEPKQLEGLTLGGAQGTPTTRLFPVFARLNGIDTDTVAYESLAPNLQEPMLIRGDIDGAYTFTVSSWFNLIANRKDPAEDFTWLNYEDYGMDLYSNGMMVSQELLEANPEAVAGLVRAVTKATMEITKDQDVAVESIVAFDNLVNAELERARLEFALTKLMNHPETAETGIGGLVEERLARSIDLIVEGYGLDATPAASEIFDGSFLPPVSERMLDVALN